VGEGKMSLGKMRVERHGLLELLNDRIKVVQAGIVVGQVELDQHRIGPNRQSRDPTFHRFLASAEHVQGTPTVTQGLSTAGFRGYGRVQQPKCL
jgi:hypothetical protein